MPVVGRGLHEEHQLGHEKCNRAGSGRNFSLRFWGRGQLLDCQKHAITSRGFLPSARMSETMTPLHLLHHVIDMHDYIKRSIAPNMKACFVVYSRFYSVEL
jgi:hypothetical protein